MEVAEFYVDVTDVDPKSDQELNVINGGDFLQLPASSDEDLSQNVNKKDSITEETISELHADLKEKKSLESFSPQQLPATSSESQALAKLSPLSPGLPPSSPSTVELLNKDQVSQETSCAKVFQGSSEPKQLFEDHASDGDMFKSTSLATRSDDEIQVDCEDNEKINMEKQERMPDNSLKDEQNFQISSDRTHTALCSTEVLNSFSEKNFNQKIQENSDYQLSKAELVELQNPDTTTEHLPTDTCSSQNVDDKQATLIDCNQSNEVQESKMNDCRSVDLNEETHNFSKQEIDSFDQNNVEVLNNATSKASNLLDDIIEKPALLSTKNEDQKVSVSFSQTFAADQVLSDQLSNPLHLSKSSDQVEFKSNTAVEIEFHDNKTDKFEDTGILRETSLMLPLADDFLVAENNERKNCFCNVDDEMKHQQQCSSQKTLDHQPSETESDLPPVMYDVATKSRGEHYSGGQEMKELPQRGDYMSDKLSGQPFICYPYSYSDERWLGMVGLRGGYPRDTSAVAEARNSLETIKRKQKSLNDIIIRMLNDSTSKSHCSLETYSSPEHVLPQFPGDLMHSGETVTVEKSLCDKSNSGDGDRNDEEEDDDDDDDDENDNLEIQIDDDIDVEVTDNVKEYSEKPVVDERELSENNVPLRDDTVEVAAELNLVSDKISGFNNPESVLESEVRGTAQNSTNASEAVLGYPNNMMVKPSENLPKMDYLDSLYLYPYESRLYNLHMFDNFRPHAYHGPDFKSAPSSHHVQSLQESPNCGLPVPGGSAMGSGNMEQFSLNQSFESDAIDLTKNTRPTESEPASYMSHRQETDSVLRENRCQAAGRSSSEESKNSSESLETDVLKESRKFDSRDCEELVEVNNNVKMNSCNVIVSGNSLSSCRFEEDFISAKRQNDEKEAGNRVEARSSNSPKVSKSDENKAVDEKDLSENDLKKSSVDNVDNTSKLSMPCYNSFNNDNYYLHYQYLNNCKTSSNYPAVSDQESDISSYHGMNSFNGSTGAYFNDGHVRADKASFVRSVRNPSELADAGVLNLAKPDKPRRKTMGEKKSEGKAANLIEQGSNIASSNPEEAVIGLNMVLGLQDSSLKNTQRIDSVSPESTHCAYVCNQASESVLNCSSKISNNTTNNITTGNTGQASCGNISSSNNSSNNSSGSSSYHDSKTGQSSSGVATEHHKEMAKTKTIWRDKYLAEDSGSHFTNFSSIFRLEQCVSSISYEQPIVQKKDKLKLSANVEKELHSFRMGLKMLGHTGSKVPEDAPYERKANDSSPSPTRKSGDSKKTSASKRSKKSEKTDNSCSPSKGKPKKSSTRESKSKKVEYGDPIQNVSPHYRNFHREQHSMVAPSDNFDDSHVNDCQPPIYPSCQVSTDGISKHCIPASGVGVRDSYKLMDGYNTDMASGNDQSGEKGTGKKKRGRKKKGTKNNLNSTQGDDGHVKDTRSGHDSTDYPHVKDYFPKNISAGYQDTNDYCSAQQSFQPDQSTHGYMASQNEVSIPASAILKVPNSQSTLQYSTQFSDKNETNNESKKLTKSSKKKSKKNSRNLNNCERSSDEEAYTCNRSSLDIYLNKSETSEHIRLEQNQEKPQEQCETDPALTLAVSSLTKEMPFTFDPNLKVFTCLCCSYQVKRKGQLMKHLGGHQLYVCTHCNEKCSDRKQLEGHLLTRHPTRCGRRLCKRCHVLFRVEELDNHEAECTGEKQGWACDICGKKFRFLSAVKNHVGKWHKNEKSRFDSRLDSSAGEEKTDSRDSVEHRGGVEYVDEATILDDIQIVDLPHVETTSIDMTPDFRALLESEGIRHAGEISTDAGCAEKNSTLRLSRSSEPDSEKHLETSAEKKVRIFSCDSCPKFYRSMQSLKNHKLKKHGQDAGQNSDSKRQEEPESSEMSNNVKISAPQNEMPVIQLESNNEVAAVNQSSSPPENSDQSSEEITPEESNIQKCKDVRKQFKCKINSSNEQNSECLDKEESSGTTINKDVAEEVIPKSSVENSAETEALQSSASHLPLSDGWFQCTFEGCSKKFRKLEQVQKHEERHPIDKIYKCDWPSCKKAYIHYANLYSHRSHHVTAKPFICTICSSAYWQKCSLNSHKARVHGIKNIAQIPASVDSSGDGSSSRRKNKPRSCNGNNQKDNRPSLDTCDDDSRTITSAVSDAEPELPEKASGSDTDTLQHKDDDTTTDRDADECSYNRNSSCLNSDSNASSTNRPSLKEDHSKLRTESKSIKTTRNTFLSSRVSSKNKKVEAISDLEQSRSEMHSESAGPVKEVVPLPDSQPASIKKKRGRKPKSTSTASSIQKSEREDYRAESLDRCKASSDRLKDVCHSEESGSVADKIENVSETHVTEKHRDSLVGEAAKSYKMLEKQEFRDLEAAAREIESCDDASSEKVSGLAKTKTKRKIRTSLNSMKRSKLAKKGDVEGEPVECSVNSNSENSSVNVRINDKNCDESLKTIKKTAGENSKVDEVDKTFTAVVASNIVSSQGKEIEKTVSSGGDLTCSEMSTSNELEKERSESGVFGACNGSSAETKAALSDSNSDKPSGNVYEFCESENEDNLESKKSKPKKKMPIKKHESKPLEVVLNTQENEIDDDASLDFHLMRDKGKPFKTYLDRPKRRTQVFGVEPVNATLSPKSDRDFSPTSVKIKQKRKSKFESPERDHRSCKRFKKDEIEHDDFLSSSRNAEDTFESSRSAAVADKKEVSDLEVANKGSACEEHQTALTAAPTAVVRKASKRRKNEVEVLLEDTLSRPATADKKSGGLRNSKRAELFNFDKPAAKVETSLEPKKSDAKLVSAKKGSKQKEQISEECHDKPVPSNPIVVPVGESSGKDSVSDADSQKTECSSTEANWQPSESRLAKKRKAESLVPVFFEDTSKEKEMSIAITNHQPEVDSIVLKDLDVDANMGELPTGSENEDVVVPSNAEEIEREDEEEEGSTLSNPIIDLPGTDAKSEVVTSSCDVSQSGTNIILKLRIKELEQFSQCSEEISEKEPRIDTPAAEGDLCEGIEVEPCESREVFDNVSNLETREVATDQISANDKFDTGDTDSQLSLIDSLEYLRIAEVEKSSLISDEVANVELPEDTVTLKPKLPTGETAPATGEKSAYANCKDDEYFLEDSEDNGGFVRPSEPPSTWRNYDYEDSGYEHINKKKKKIMNISEASPAVRVIAASVVEGNGRKQDAEKVKEIVGHLENTSADAVTCLNKSPNEGNNSPEKRIDVCSNSQGGQEPEGEMMMLMRRREDSHIHNVTYTQLPGPNEEKIDEMRGDKPYQVKNRNYDHTPPESGPYHPGNFRNGLPSSRSMTPSSSYHPPKELNHPVSNLHHQKDSKLSVDTLTDSQSYSSSCASSYFDYTSGLSKKSEPHPLSSLESLATLAPTSGGYFESASGQEKRLANDPNKTRLNNFHPEIPPPPLPPPSHTPFPSNPYHNFSGYEADLALLTANRHKAYRYNDRPFDPSLAVAYAYDRPADFHHSSYHVGSNFASPDSRFFSQFLQSSDPVDQRYYVGQQAGFSDFHKATAGSVAADPKNKFSSTSFTSLLTGSPYSGISDSYLSTLTPNIPNAPTLATNQLTGYSRSESWINERPWTAAPPSTNDSSVGNLYQQQQQHHGPSRKQQPPQVGGSGEYDGHVSKKTPATSSSSSGRGGNEPHFYNTYETSSPRLRNLATPGPAPPTHKRLEEAYRQAAAMMTSDYHQHHHHHHPSLIQPTPGPAADVYGSVDPMVNSAAFSGFNRYYYSAARDAVYRSQRLAAIHHHHQQQQQQQQNSPLSPFSNAVNLAGFPAPGYPPDPFAGIPASSTGVPLPYPSSKNQHYPGGGGGGGGGGHGSNGGGKHHHIQPLPTSTGGPAQTSTKNSKSSKSSLTPLGLGGSLDHLNPSNFLHQQNPLQSDPYRQSVIYNMMPKYF